MCLTHRLSLQPLGYHNTACIPSSGGSPSRRVPCTTTRVVCPLLLVLESAEVPSKLMQRKLRRSETRRKLMGSRAARSLLGPLVDGYRDLEPAKQTLSRPGVNFLCLDCNLLLMFPSLHLTLRSIQANAAVSDKHAALQYIHVAVNSCFCCRQQRGKHGQGRSGRRWISAVVEVAPRLQKSSSQ